MFVESRFPSAQDCIEDALGEAVGDPDAMAELFAYRAATLLARRFEDEARESVEVVLALQPDWTADDPLLTSPRITEMVESVRGAFDVSAGRPSLEHEPADVELVDGTALVVQARAPHVDAPLEASLMVRRAGESRFRAVPLRGRPGRYLTARVELDPGERVAYYLAVLTPGGWAAMQSGSAEDPFFAEREGGTPVPDAGPTGPPDTGPGPTPGIGRRYWWLWTAIGVLGAGAIVGLAVALSLDSGDPTGSVRLTFGN